MSFITQSPLELYVKGFLRTEGIRTIGKQYAQKAIALIDEKLGIPCCDDSTTTIDLVTRFDNNFTNTVKMLLTTMVKTGNKQSLIRAKKYINNFITCCALKPTVPVTNDAADTFDWTYTPSHTSPSNYEYTTDGGLTYSNVTTKPITGLIGEYAVGTVGVRVKAAAGKTASATLFNTVAFT